MDRMTLSGSEDRTPIRLFDLDPNLFTTEGRLRRTHYIAVTAVMTAFAWLVPPILERWLPPIMSKPLGCSLLAAYGWASYCIQVRRAHDLGRGTWLVSVGCFALLAAVFAFAWGYYGPANQLPFPEVATWCAMTMIMLHVSVQAWLAFAPGDDHNEWGPNPR